MPSSRPRSIEADARGEVLLVGLREGVEVAAAEDGAHLLAVLGDDRGLEVVAPGPGGLGEPALEVGGVDVGDALALAQVHDEVDAGGGGLVDADRELHRLRTQSVLEDAGELLADAGVVAVARQVDEHRDVAAVGVLPDEHADGAALAGLHRRLHERAELVDRGVEQVVARVGLEGVEQRLAGVALGVEAAVLEDRLRLLLDERDAEQRLGVGGTGEQAEEAALAGDLAVLAEGLHADVVEVGRAVHRGAGVGLGEHEQRLLARLGPHRLGEPAEGVADLLVGAQDAEPGAGDAPAARRPRAVAVEVDPVEGVLAVAEEREVLPGEPLEQLGGLPDLVAVERRRLVAQLGDDLGDPLVHLDPVLDGLADVAQHPLHVGDDHLRVVALAQPVDLDVHPRLPHHALVRRGGAVGHRGRGLQGAGDVALDVEQRVDHEVDVAQLAAQLHGERVDEERHVVDDDLDDRVAARRPAVLGRTSASRPAPGRCPAAGRRPACSGWRGRRRRRPRSARRGPRPRRGGSRPAAGRRPGRGAGRRCPSRAGRGRPPSPGGRSCPSRASPLTRGSTLDPSGPPSGTDLGVGRGWSRPATRPSGRARGTGRAWSRGRAATRRAP